MQTLLFVDDEALFLRLMREFFEMRGHKVVTADNGYEALSKVKDLRPAAVFLDIRMPGMDGGRDIPPHPRGRCADACSDRVGADLRRSGS